MAAWMHHRMARVNNNDDWDFYVIACFADYYFVLPNQVSPFVSGTILYREIRRGFLCSNNQ